MDAQAALQQHYWLALDTATANMTIAIMKGTEQVAIHESTAERNHSVLLIPAIQELLSEAGMRTGDLQYIAIGRGPGSYTGTRIGVTVAKTLAWSLHIPVVGVSSAAALAYGYTSRAAVNERTWIVPIMDARRGQVYTGLYEWLPSGAAMGTQGVGSETEGAQDIGWRCLEADQIRIFAEWLEEVRIRIGQLPEDERPSQIVAIGDRDRFQEHIGLWIEQTGMPLVAILDYVHAGAVAGLAWEQIVRGKFDEPHQLVPNYTQLAEAEVKWLAKQG